MYKLCQDSCFCNDLSIAERMALIADAGFTATALSWTDDIIAGREACLEPYEKHVGIARAAGLEVDNIHCEYMTADALWGEGEATVAYLAVIEKTIRECGECGVPMIIFHPANNVIGGRFDPRGLERFQKLVRLAEDCGVKIAVENIRNGEHLNYLLSNVESPAVGFCYDIGHRNCFASYIPYLEHFGDRLYALHLHDNHGKSDEHLIPMDGTVDWYEFYAQMKKLSYTGVIELESMSFGYKNGQFADYAAWLAESYRRAVMIRENLEK